MFGGSLFLLFLAVVLFVIGLFDPMDISHIIFWHGLAFGFFWAGVVFMLVSFFS